MSVHFARQAAQAQAEIRYQFLEENKKIQADVAAGVGALTGVTNRLAAVDANNMNSSTVAASYMGDDGKDSSNNYSYSSNTNSSIRSPDFNWSAHCFDLNLGTHKATKKIHASPSSPSMETTPSSQLYNNYKKSDTSVDHRHTPAISGNDFPNELDDVARASIEEHFLTSPRAKRKYRAAMKSLNSPIGADAAGTAGKNQKKQVRNPGWMDVFIPVTGHVTGREEVAVDSVSQLSPTQTHGTSQALSVSAPSSLSFQPTVTSELESAPPLMAMAVTSSSQTGESSRKQLPKCQPLTHLYHHRIIPPHRRLILLSWVPRQE